MTASSFRTVVCLWCAALAFSGCDRTSQTQSQTQSGGGSQSAGDSLQSVSDKALVWSVKAAGFLNDTNSLGGLRRPAFFMDKSMDNSDAESNLGKTLSPYFMLKSKDKSTEPFPLLTTDVKARIAGVIADVSVTQVYKNSGKKPIEAVYIFPASTRAAVYEVTMTVGDRTLTALIKERAKARADYEQAKAEGKSASLLEQQRPNVFQMNVANILPGDTIKVKMSYTELLVPTEGVYEFVYPTTVGPRYSNQAEPAAAETDKFVKTPYTHQGDAPPSGFDIAVDVSAGMPIDGMRCTSHPVLMDYDGKANASVRLDNTGDTGGKGGGNRDYILRYKLAGGQIQSGVMLYKGNGENFFLAMLQPPKRVETGAVPKRDYIFLIDVSGSMEGTPLAITKKLLKNLLSNLVPTETFNVVLFSNSVGTLSETSVPATKENLERALKLIDTQRGGGSTEIVPALKHVFKLPKKEEVSRTVVAITDGYVSVEKEVFALIRRNLDKANVFSFGIGSSVNRELIDGMARAGMGEPLVVTKLEEGDEKAETFRRYIQTPVLTNVKVRFDGIETSDIEPPVLPDVLAERPVIVFGKWRGETKGALTLSGIGGGNGGGAPYEQRIELNTVQPMERNRALRYLWARHRIAALNDDEAMSRSSSTGDSTIVQRITELGLKYNLLTAYTSFVAVDSKVRNKDGSLQAVTQPSAMPEGVSDNSIGSGSMGGGLSGIGSSGGGVGVGGMGLGRGGTGLASKHQLNLRAVIRKPVVTDKGKRSADEIKRVYSTNSNAILSCYENAKAGGAGSGTLVVKVLIRPDGSVANASVKSSTLKNENLERCVIARIKRFQFSVLNAQETQQVEIPISFED